MNIRNDLLGKSLLIVGLAGATLQGSEAGQAGSLTREAWANVPGGKLADFTASARYWQTADAVTTFAGAAAPSNAANSFAARVRGYVTAPVTGDYTFWIASDDDSELRLSTDSLKANRVKIASVAGWVNPQVWDTKASQKSATIHLVAGQRYFIEALHVDAGGADHLAIAWQIPGGQRELIPASALESFTGEANDVDNDELPDDWETAHGYSLTDNGTLHPDQHPLADPDHDGFSNLEEAQYGTAPLVRGGVPGSLLLDTWTGIGGSSVQDLTWSTRFSAAPTTSEFIFSAQTPADRADNYGARMRGCVIAPVSGEYTFYVAGDDSSELWLSSSASQFGKVRIASLDGYSAVGQWTKFASQKSAKITLVAGEKYYIEALVKEGGGGDHLAIGWQRPGVTPIEVIPGSALESYAYDAADADGDNMPADWETLHGLNPAVKDGSADPDKDGIPNWLEYAGGSDPQVANTLAGGLVHEVWTGIPGFLLRDLRNSPKFLQEPATRNLVTRAQAPSDIGDMYGSRLRGYLTAPVSGDYTFWVSADDQSEFWLSTSQSKFDKQLLVRPNVVSYGYDADLSQKSRTVTLVAGQRYYLEVLHKADYASDFVSVAWQKPGGVREIIPGSVLGTFVPTADDADDDGLPDAWETANGLSPADNGRINPLNGANGDLDGDGLSNAAEYAAGTKANLADSDGDGVSDRDESLVTGTNSNVADIAAFETLGSLSGSSFGSKGGEWQIEGGKALQRGPRGWLDYPVSVPAAGIYQLDGAFTPVANNLTSVHEIVFTVDDGVPQRVVVNADLGAQAHAKVLTPWLAAGTHTVRVFVDNSYEFRRVSIDQLTVAAARGADADANGIPDWVTAKIALRNTSEAPSQSKISPVCLEGAALWPQLSKVAGIAPHAAPNDRWYANVALDANGPTSVAIELENGAIQRQQLVEWIPTNLLQEESITLRVGDSLRLTAFVGQAGTVQESVQITGLGSNQQTTADEPIETLFSYPGVYPLQVTHVSDGVVTQKTVVVTVVGAPQLGSITSVPGHYRTLDVPTAAAGVTFSFDERIEMMNQPVVSPNGRRYTLRSDDPASRYGVYRIGAAGPILARFEVASLRMRDADQTAVYFAGTLENNTYQMEMPVLVDGTRQADVTIRYDIIIGGVTFEDGSLQKNLNAVTDFSADGRKVLQFLKVSKSGSNCHRASIWQGDVKIAGF